MGGGGGGEIMDSIAVAQEINLNALSVFKCTICIEAQSALEHKVCTGKEKANRKPIHAICPVQAIASTLVAQL